MFDRNNLINKIIELDIKPILVGGYIRDKLLDDKIDSKDIDIELYTDKNYEEILELLEKENFKCDIVGKHFGVIKVKTEDGNDFDLSLPRKEKSIGDKHTDFEIISDGTMSYNEAFKRRDFTINAIGYDLIENKLIDIYNGKIDLENKIIKHVNSKTFVEDPLRVYRAIQFASRFEFDIHQETKDLIINMIKNGLLDELPKERIFVEFDKLLTKSKKPSIGFELMREFGILEKYFKELNDLIGVEQEKKWHPEGDVWIHTMMVIDKMANIECDKNKKTLYMLSCLCHDLGKPEYTLKDENGKITSQGHEVGGIEPTLKFLEKITNDIKLKEQVCKLVELHLQPSLFYANNAKNPAIKRLNNKLIESDLSIIDLALINKADGLGRTTEEALKNESPQFDWIMNKFYSLNLSTQKIVGLINGKDLIELGLKPGKEFKEILNQCYDYQIDNEIEEKKIMLNYLYDVILNEMNNELIEEIKGL